MPSGGHRGAAGGSPGFCSVQENPLVGPRPASASATTTPRKTILRLCCWNCSKHDSQWSFPKPSLWEADGPIQGPGPSFLGTAEASPELRPEWAPPGSLAIPGSFPQGSSYLAPFNCLVCTASSLGRPTSVISGPCGGTPHSLGIKWIPILGGWAFC